MDRCADHPELKAVWQREARENVIVFLVNALAPQVSVHLSCATQDYPLTGQGQTSRT